jgi:hypothetical protein
VGEGEAPETARDRRRPRASSSSTNPPVVGPVQEQFCMLAPAPVAHLLCFETGASVPKGASRAAQHRACV